MGIIAESALDKTLIVPEEPLMVRNTGNFLRSQ